MSENEHSLSELGTNQRRALEALLAEPSIRAAAEACKLTERTLYRYLSDPAFRAELHARQDEILAATTAALVGLTGDALSELRRIMTGGDTDSVRVRAIATWLRHTRDAVELDQLAERVAALEEGLRQ
jgi:aryl carrier-like protein